MRVLALSVCVIIQRIHHSECNWLGKVVGGKYASINDFPHSAALKIKCANKDMAHYFVCGSSIINQVLLLTAAHCTYGCFEHSFMEASVGHRNSKKGLVHVVESFILHPAYKNGPTHNDISIVKLKKPVKFGPSVARVALMKKPPYYESALIAGWGYIDEDRKISDSHLKYVDQHVWTKARCKQVLHRMPKGTICATSGTELDYPSMGDSGSALVVRGHIQLGIVSYKVPKASRTLIVYTDTGYFYDWIINTSKLLYCHQSNKNQ